MASTKILPAPMGAPRVHKAMESILEEQWANEYSGVTCSDPENELRGVISFIAGPFVDSAARTLESGGASAWEPLNDDVGPEAIWTDLRPSEAIHLMKMIEAAVDRAATRCQAIILEELAAAGLAFAAENPELTPTAFVA
jgi:hypothetical protein